jgi:hypothetical protein
MADVLWRPWFGDIPSAIVSILVEDANHVSYEQNEQYRA